MHSGLALAFSLCGRLRWEATSRALVARLNATCMPIAPACFDVHEVEGLPSPEQRYFRAAAGARYFWNVSAS